MLQTKTNIIIMSLTGAPSQDLAVSNLKTNTISASTVTTLSLSASPTGGVPNAAILPILSVDTGAEIGSLVASNNGEYYSLSLSIIAQNITLTQNVPFAYIANYLAQNDLDATINFYNPQAATIAQASGSVFITISKDGQIYPPTDGPNAPVIIPSAEIGNNTPCAPGYVLVQRGNHTVCEPLIKNRGNFLEDYNR